MMFNWPIRVYYEDTDSGGVVYHARYLSFMEQARTEWLRSFGIEQDNLLRQHDCLFAVRDIQIAYRKPALFNDMLQIETALVTLKKASFIFEQIIRRQQTVLCQATVTVACLQASTFMPQGIPSFLSKELKS